MLHFTSIVTFALLCQLFHLAGAAESEAWHVVGTTPLPNNYLRLMVAEGLCNDGTNFIINSKDQIFVMKENFDVILQNDNAIPVHLRTDMGYNHLGDCQFHNNLIYYAVEEDSYTHPAIFVYEMNNTAIKFRRYKATSQQHMPWVAMDTSSGMLYSSEFNNVTSLNAYNALTLEFVRTLNISMILDQVQGGAFYEGLLYLGVNSQDAVYTVNVTTGEVNLVLNQAQDASLEEYEFEGLTFLDLRASGKGIMHNTGNHRQPEAMTHSDFF